MSISFRKIPMTKRRVACFRRLRFVRLLYITLAIFAAILCAIFFWWCRLRSAISVLYYATLDSVLRITCAVLLIRTVCYFCWCGLVHVSTSIARSWLGVHRIVIFTIRPDTGFAGYLKKIRSDTGYFINLNTWHIIYIYKDFLINVLVQKKVTLFF
jgi:hypothetical protein